MGKVLDINEINNNMIILVELRLNELMDDYIDFDVKHEVSCLLGNTNEVLSYLAFDKTILFVFNILNKHIEDKDELNLTIEHFYNIQSLINVYTLGNPRSEYIKNMNLGIAILDFEIYRALRIKKQFGIKKDLPLNYESIQFKNIKDKIDSLKKLYRQFYIGCINHDLYITSIDSIIQGTIKDISDLIEKSKNNRGQNFNKCLDILLKAITIMQSASEYYKSKADDGTIKVRKKPQF